MLKFGVSMRWNGLRLAASGMRRLLIVAFVLAFTASGLTHVVGFGHAAADAASVPSYAVSFAGDVGVDEPCCPEHTGKLHASDCSVAGGCSLCAPIVGYMTAVPRSEARSNEVQPDDAHIGRAPSPRFRPPKLSVNA